MEELGDLAPLHSVILVLLFLDPPLALSLLNLNELLDLMLSQMQSVVN
jgi:hypothetical protein